MNCPVSDPTAWEGPESVEIQPRRGGPEWVSRDRGNTLRKNELGSPRRGFVGRNVTVTQAVGLAVGLARYSRISFSNCSAVSFPLRSAPSRRLSARSRFVACRSVMRSSIVPFVMKR